MATMKHIMQENDYENDPLSQGALPLFSHCSFRIVFFINILCCIGDPGNAICSRYDLRTKSPPAFGAIDAKVRSLILALKHSKMSVDDQPTDGGQRAR